MPALCLGILAILLALPVLWWRISMQPVASSLGGEIAQQIGAAAQSVSAAPPDWYAAVRASALLAAFLSLLLAIVALILRNSARMAGIAAVLALAACVASSSGLTLTIAGGVVLLVTLMLTLGLG